LSERAKRLPRTRKPRSVFFEVMRTKSRKEAIGLKDVIQLPDTWKLYSERRKKINGVTYVSERYIQKRGRGNRNRFTNPIYRREPAGQILGV